MSEEKRKVCNDQLTESIESKAIDKLNDMVNFSNDYINFRYNCFYALEKYDSKEQLPKDFIRNYKDMYKKLKIENAKIKSEINLINRKIVDKFMK